MLISETATAARRIGPARRAGRRRYSAGWTAAFGGTLLVVVSRGVFETVIGRQGAYALQVAVIVSFCLALLALGRPRVKGQPGRGLLLLYLFGFFGLVSATFTALVNPSVPFAYYLGVMVFLVAMACFFSGLRFAAAERIDFAKAIVFVVAVLIAVASAQQFAGFTSFPGTDSGSLSGQIRPSSTTGSYLHYPLVLALAAFLIAQMAIVKRSRILFAVALGSAAAVVASYSRSGMMILAFGAIAYLAIAVRRKRLRFGTLYSGAIVVTGVVVAFWGSDYMTRALSAFDPEGGGNRTRIGQWGYALRLVADSPILFGSRTGAITNVTRNLSDAGSNVVESGFLQQLVNFGVLGTLVFYAVLLAAIAAVPTDHLWARAGMYGALVQTFVYQSVEVLPFMFTFAIFPLVLGSMQLGDEGSESAVMERPPG